MNARLLDVLHDAADQDAFAVADAVDVDFNCEIEKTVEQHRAVIRYIYGGFHIDTEIIITVDNLHGAAAQYVGWPHDERVTDIGTHLDRLFLVSRRAVRRLPQMQRLHQLLEAFSIFSKIDRIRRCADNWRACRFEFSRQLQWCLAAVLDDDSLRFLRVDNFHDVFERQRFEIQPVRRVVIRRDSFGIAVDHDRLVARLFERQCRVHAAVVELDTLPDSVGATAENHDLRSVRRLGLAFFFVRRVQVCRTR